MARVRAVSRVRARVVARVRAVSRIRARLVARLEQCLGLGPG